MKIFFSLLLTLLSQITDACECPPIKPISKESGNNYDVIFFGKIDSVSSCPVKGNAIAYFTVSQLYKGRIQQHLKINFDCSTPCMMSFSKDEEWLIYSTFKRFDEMNVTLCGHSRKFFGDVSKDFYQTNAQRTFEEEKFFLKETFGIQTFPQNTASNKQQQDSNPQNEQPSGIIKLILILISFTVMAIVYVITRNKK